MATLLALPSPEEAAAAVRERVRSAQARAAETGLDYDGGRPGGKTLPRRTSLQLITTEEEGDVSSAVDTLSLVVPRKTRKDLIAQFQVPPAPLWLVEQVPALDQLNLGRDPQEQQARAAALSRAAACAARRPASAAALSDYARRRRTRGFMFLRTLFVYCIFFIILFMRMRTHAACSGRPHPRTHPIFIFTAGS